MSCGSFMYIGEVPPREILKKIRPAELRLAQWTLWIDSAGSCRMLLEWQFLGEGLEGNGWISGREPFSNLWATSTPKCGWKIKMCLFWLRRTSRIQHRCSFLVIGWWWFRVWKEQPYSCGSIQYVQYPCGYLYSWAVDAWCFTTPGVIYLFPTLFTWTTTYSYILIHHLVKGYQQSCYIMCHHFHHHSPLLEAKEVLLRPLVAVQCVILWVLNDRIILLFRNLTLACLNVRDPKNAVASPRRLEHSPWMYGYVSYWDTASI